MGSPANVRYQINAADHITTVNEAWVAFARGNSGDHLLPPPIIGRSLWSAITDPTTIQIYRSLVGRARKGEGPVRFRFRCDAPDRRRLLEMQIDGASGGAVNFETCLIESQVRPAVPLIDISTRRSDALITICAWCMKIQISNGKWLEIEAAVEAIGLFERSPLPHLSHGMCPDCYDVMMGVVKAV